MESGGRLYVPDTKKWTNFYMQISKGNVSPYIDHTMKRYQRGGGLRNNTSPFMVSIDKYARELNEREIRPKIKIRPTFFYFRFYGSADPNLSQNEIKIKVPNSCFIFIPPADSSSMAIQKIKKNVHKLFLQVL